MNALNVIRKPVVTEKTSLLQEKQVYAFWVSPKASKVEVKKAVKALYGADVSTVRMVSVAAKYRQIKKGTMNKRKETRKAYITLKGGMKLDLNKFGKAEKVTETKIAVSKPKAEKKTAEKTEKKAPKAAAKKTK